MVIVTPAIDSGALADAEPVLEQSFLELVVANADRPVAGSVSVGRLKPGVDFVAQFRPEGKG